MDVEDVSARAEDPSDFDDVSTSAEDDQDRGE
jgi:hypothetical protein